MAFFNNIMVGIVDLVDRAKQAITNTPSPMASLPIDLIVYLFSVVTDPKDVGSLERTCKGLWQIASNPLTSIHTPHRLACRELSLKIGDEMEKVAVSNSNRPLDSTENHGISFFVQQLSYYESFLRGQYGDALKSVSIILPQKIDFANLSDDQAKMYELAGRALIEGITKSKLNLKGAHAILNGRDATLVLKVSTAKNAFSDIIYKNLMKSYVRQTEDKITPQSYVAKVAQLCLFTENSEDTVTRHLESELWDVHDNDFTSQFFKDLEAFKKKASSSETTSESSSSDSESIGYPLLVDFGIVIEKDYKEQLECYPNDLAERGIKSQEDLEIICPTLSLIIDLIQKEDDAQQLDRLEAQKRAGRRRQNLSDVVDTMCGALKKMTTEVRTCGKDLYGKMNLSDLGCPWSALEQELTAIQDELDAIESGNATEFIAAFSAENYNALADRINALANKFNEEFPKLYRAHQLKKLHAYIHQVHILKAWNGGSKTGLTLASLPTPEQTLDRLFQIGE